MIKKKFGPRRSREMRAASLAINELLEQLKLTSAIRAGQIVTQWAELVGPRIADKTRADGITDRILWVEVATSSWLHELNMLRPQLVRDLTARLGLPRMFDDVKFRLAGRTRRDSGDGRNAADGASVDPRRYQPRKPPPPPPPRAPASIEARERIVREVGSVEDPELRALIAKVRIQHDR